MYSGSGDSQSVYKLLNRKYNNVIEQSRRRRIVSDIIASSDKCKVVWQDVKKEAKTEMSWLFGSTKKKDLQVTVDPNPVDGFCVVQNRMQQNGPGTQMVSDQQHRLYPNLDGSSSWGANTKLPYPTSPTPSSSSSNVIGTGPLSSSAARIGRGLEGVHVQNQLESVPFQLSAHLQSFSTGSGSQFDIRSVTDSLNRAKRHIKDGEYNYNFNLERRILNEERMVNGHRYIPLS